MSMNVVEDDIDEFISSYIMIFQYVSVIYNPRCPPRALYLYHVYNTCIYLLLCGIDYALMYLQ